MAPTVLLSVETITKGFGSRPLFERLSFGLSDGDHVALIGPNGSGKSTLLRVLAGIDEPDSGTRALRRGTHIGFVPQTPSFPADQPVDAIMVAALARSARAHSLDEHELHVDAASTLRRAGFDDPTQLAGTLSGGWSKRLAIACELVAEPDVLLMDEPTNHLDVEGILWLEGVLRNDPLAFIVVSHDRYFLENIARRVVELNPAYAGGLFEAAGSYTDFLEKRDEVFRSQAAYQESLANVVRREVEWLRRGAKARTRKAQARIDEANRKIDELAESKDRARTSSAGIDFTSSDRKTKRLLTVRDLSKSFEDRTIIDGLDLLLTPGLRLGLLGPNGSGKTTLLNLLDGTLAPDRGTVTPAEGLRIVRFRQDRSTLDLETTLRRALVPDGDTVMYRERPIHVVSWAKRFLFRAEQLDTQVARLSGGEQARILIARLMLEPADLLILDEPTNDLDIATLEVLEESLLDFPGGLILVTHDRYLLDRVSTQILALDGDGGAEHFADYAQWESSRRGKSSASRQSGAPPRAAAPPPVAKKLTYKEKREWEGMEAAIAAAEARAAAAETALHDPKIAADAGELQTRSTAAIAARSEVERLFARWAELEGKQ
jgi:ATP-binding cassette subfamily F protein uup